VNAKLDLTPFLLRLVPHILANAPAIAKALWHQTEGNLPEAKQRLRFMGDHKSDWQRAQPGFAERLKKLEGNDPPSEDEN
jgi:hypothetical protein